MADLLLSQSLLQNNDPNQSADSRDPFQQAQAQYQSRQQGDVLSSSPAQPQSQDISNQAPIKDFTKMLSGLGIDASGIANNDIGRAQLNGRLKAKFGDNYMQNSQAAEVLNSFDQQIKRDSSGAASSMNKSLEMANRTLGAIFGQAKPSIGGLNG